MKHKYILKNPLNTKDIQDKHLGAGGVAQVGSAHLGNVRPWVQSQYCQEQTKTNLNTLETSGTICFLRAVKKII
jgi:hypothetical protein